MGLTVVIHVHELVYKSSAVRIHDCSSRVYTSGCYYTLFSLCCSGSRVGAGSGRKLHNDGASKPARVGGPPVQGLYDHPKSPARTSTPLYISSPERRQLNFSLMQTATRSNHGTSATTVTHSSGTVGRLGVEGDGMSQVSPTSPAQLDPFYSQGETLGSGDNAHECWVTVFGFPAAAASYVLEQFSQYGTILRHSMSSDGNWMHLLFQSRLQAKKALSKNGKVYGNGIMIGVQPCIDKRVVESYVPGSESVPQSLGPAAPTPSSKPSTIRPLTAAYQASSGVNQVAPAHPNTPQKSTGFLSKAFEYVFGW
jgi:nuclear pore complex protein Nup53